MLDEQYKKELDWKQKFPRELAKFRKTDVGGFNQINNEL